MAPTRMKLRVRRLDNASATGSDPPQNAGTPPTRRSTTRSSSRRKNTNTTRVSEPAAAAATTATTASPLPSSSSATSTTAARLVLAAEDTSPDSKCPICLDRFNNLAYLDRCLHRFCFPCIQEWSHNKAECPLCKQPFSSILHSVRAENDFKEYTLRPLPENGSVAATVAMVAAMASDRRMMLSLGRIRDGGGGETATRQRSRQRRAVWELFLDSPPAPIRALPSLSPVMDGEETQPFDLSERGVIFEGLTGISGAGSLAPLPANDRVTHRLMARLVARQRLQREGGTVRRLRERETVALRRGLYRSGIRVRGVAGGNQEQPQREISAESFCRHPSNLNRLRPWLRRELTVLYGAHDSLINIVQRIIMARVARHGLENLPIIEDELRPFLLARTDHFLHELVSFARSPLSMENYDLQAIYEPPEAAMELFGVDSSSDSNSVIAISEEEEDEERRESLSDRVETVQENLGNQSGSCLSLSGWDDETPGPSYSTADTSCLSGFSPAPPELTNEDRDQPSSPRQPTQEEEEECLIVGYKKPIAERTPELVQLSSDSDDEKKDDEKKTEDDKMADEKQKTEKPQEENELATISPLMSLREETVEDAVPSRSHSYSTISPGRSQPDDHLTNTRHRRHSDKDRGESTRKKRERRRKRRRRSSGTFGNPNRSIFPPLTRRFSPNSDTTLNSSDDSDWRGYSVVSPLTTSSCPSTPLSTSSSCLGSSPLPLTLPPKEIEQNNNETAAAMEKPGGKRKYKSRHLDSDKQDPTWKPSGGGGGNGGSKNRNKAKEAERTRKEEREKRRRRRKRHRRDSGDSGGRCRLERSPSVEIVFEGTISGSQAPARKRRRRRQRNPPLNSSPLVITLDSDSCRDVANDLSSSACSSPFGSQQTVDFCHFPALPLVHSSGVGGASLGGGDIGELPVDILDRESEKSDAEIALNKSSDPISVDLSNDSETDIDVERVETVKTPISDGEDATISKDDTISSAEKSNKESNPDVADKQLLASILSALDGIAATKTDLPSTSNVSRENHFLKHGKNNSLVSNLTDKLQSHQSPFYSTSLPPFQQLAENRKVPNSPNASCSLTNAKRTENADENRTISDDFRTTHSEIAASLLALREPENSSTPPFCKDLGESSKSKHNPGTNIFNSKTATYISPERSDDSRPQSELFNHKENPDFKESDGRPNHTDFSKMFDDLAPTLDFRNQKNAEDIV